MLRASGVINHPQFGVSANGELQVHYEETKGVKNTLNGYHNHLTVANDWIYILAKAVYIENTMHACI